MKSSKLISGSEDDEEEGTMQALAMLHNTPGGDQWSDWEAYIASVDELLHSLRPSSS